MRTIEDLAHRWVTAKDEVARLKRERSALVCDHEDDGDDSPEYTGNGRGDPRLPTAPCWKLTRFDPDDCDMPGPVTWEHETERADWCPSCVARQAIHEQIRPAQQRAASLQGALLRAARRGVRG